MITSTVLGLPPGNWADWIGGVGTALAFGATSLAIWFGHRLRRTEHAEAMYDEALKVTSTSGMGADYVIQENPDGTSEKKAQTKIVVGVQNGGRREITDIDVRVETLPGSEVGHGTSEFLQAGWNLSWMFDPVDGVWVHSGISSTIEVLVIVTFKDFDGTGWEFGSNGRLLRLSHQQEKRRERWLRRNEERRDSRGQSTTPQRAVNPLSSEP
jgi:hypothetical protein